MAVSNAVSWLKIEVRIVTWSGLTKFNNSAPCISVMAFNAGTKSAATRASLIFSISSFFKLTNSKLFSIKIRRKILYFSGLRDRSTSNDFLNMAICDGKKGNTVSNNDINIISEPGSRINPLVMSKLKKAGNAKDTDAHATTQVPIIKIDPVASRPINMSKSFAAFMSADSFFVSEAWKDLITSY